MRKVVAYLLLSLDGVQEAPNKWVFDHFDPEMMAHLQSLIDSQDAVLLGRATYEGWSTFWPTSTHEPFASFINNTPKYVVSTTLTNVTAWKNSSLVTGDLAAEVVRLKGQPGKDIGVHGSATLMRSMLEDKLVDELRLAVLPVIAGSGERLFGGSIETQRMVLADAKKTSTGVMLLTYQPRCS